MTLTNGAKLERIRHFYAAFDRYAQTVDNYNRHRDRLLFLNF
jgi:hypothetical protein